MGAGAGAGAGSGEASGAGAGVGAGAGAGAVALVTVATLATSDDFLIFICIFLKKLLNPEDKPVAVAVELDRYESVGVIPAFLFFLNLKNPRFFGLAVAVAAMDEMACAKDTVLICV